MISEPGCGMFLKVSAHIKTKSTKCLQLRRLLKVEGSSPWNICFQKQLWLQQIKIQIRFFIFCCPLLDTVFNCNIWPLTQGFPVTALATQVYIPNILFSRTGFSGLGLGVFTLNIINWFPEPSKEKDKHWQTLHSFIWASFSICNITAWYTDWLSVFWIVWTTVDKVNGSDRNET